jgi:hypothetical protein
MPPSRALPLLYQLLTAFLEHHGLRCSVIGVQIPASDEGEVRMLSVAMIVLALAVFGAMFAFVGFCERV